MPVSVFDNSIFSSEPLLSHIHFDSSFTMQLNNNLVVFAHNGICKTSLAQFLSAKYQDQFFLISYNNGLSKYSSIKENKKIVIKADSTNYEKAVAAHAEATASLGIKNRINDILGLSPTAASKCGIPFFETVAKTNTIRTLTISNEVFIDINNRIGMVRKEIGKNLKSLLTSTANLPREMDNMKELVVHTFAVSYLKNLQRDEDSLKCPICGKDLGAGVGLRQLLNDLINSTSSAINPIFSEYISTHNATDNSNLISNIIYVFSNYSEDQICEYLLLDGDYDNFLDINNLILDESSKRSAVNSEHSRLAALGSEMSNSIDTIKDVFVNKMGFSSVNYSSRDFAIEIKTSASKSMDKYSTGELNLMIFLLELCISKGNDKPTIVLDDPISSYDIPNQYRIVFEITDYLFNHSNKNVLLFTHNLEVVNIVMGYSFGIAFEYKYVEKYSDKLYLMDIPINYHSYSIDLEQIINSDSLGYLKAIQYRDNPVYRSLPSRANLNKIFHYDDSFTNESFDSHILTNQFLVDYIDTNQFIPISLGTFVDNQRTKIMALVALRVFIEYKFAMVNTTFSSTLRGTLGKKIGTIESNPIMLNDLALCYPNFKMSVMKRTKTLLNQNEHYNSQVTPFYYAMNISLQDVVDEVKLIKDMFI